MLLDLRLSTSTFADAGPEDRLRHICPHHQPPVCKHVSTVFGQVHHETAVAESMDDAIGELVRQCRRLQEARTEVGLLCTRDGSNISARPAVP